MALSKYKLGELIEESFRKNDKLEYGIDYVRGISNNKTITQTKADVDESVIHKFYIVNPGEFVYNPRTTRMGDKVGLGFNRSENPLLFSFNNIAFCIKETAKSIILPEYLYMYFNRSEFDRYAITNSWGSATELFSFEELSDIEIDLPSLDIQQKYVDVYNAMLANQQTYERGLEDLKLVCDATLEDLKKNYPIKSFGEYIKRVDERNIGNKYKNVKNVSVTKEFSDVSSKVNKNELSGYKIVRPRQIAFVQTTHNEHVFCNALNNTNDVILVTSVNEVFECDESMILPEYLCINFNRSEFDRYARFNSWGSARETFTWTDLQEVKIPIPPIEVQRALSNLFTIYRERKQFNVLLKSQIKDLCPILIKGSIEEGRKD
ncbi:MAG: restriction endonuclease subunit S [Bacteroidales bacterium]|nr:restriction endonuclease subunit S [Bacteroidales bacterium]